ncbi:TPM domain-containing protein [Yersinia pseudotuberculosis]
MPSLQHQVTDLAGVLTDNEQRLLIKQLEALHQKTSIQLALLVIPTTGDDTIEQFAIRTFDQWRLGSASHDDGALLLVAWGDHTVRLEVGYGLEGIITDIQAKNIIHSIMLPPFKQGKIHDGISVGIKEISDLLAQNPEAVVSLQQAPRFPHILSAFLLWGAGLFVLPLWVFRKSSFWARIIKSSTLCSALFGLGSLFSAYYIDYIVMFIIAVVLLLIVSAIFLDRTSDNTSQRAGKLLGKKKQSSRISTSSSSDSSSRDSDSNFSGDGGSSGGGGASDRW